MANTISPNMGLIVPGVGTEASPTWATDLNASLSSIDSHNHSSGQGVQISPNGMNINADLAFQNNNATTLRSARFSPQGAVLSQPADVGCLYVVGNELYYNDVTGGHNVQITSSGTVNATSSGISSGTASAAFSAGVLVVKSSSTSGANILMQSAVLTNSGNLTNQLTLEAPTLSGSYNLALPAVPGSLSFMTLDASGNMGTASSVSGSQIASGSITGTQLASQTVTQGLLALKSTGTTVGAGGVAVSNSSGVFSGSALSPTAVTNLSVTVTSLGRPVTVFLMADGSGNQSSVGVTGSSATSTALVYIYRGSTLVSLTPVTTSATGATATQVNIPPGAVQYLDVVTAGTYTYAIKYESAATAEFINCVLVAYET